MEDQKSKFLILKRPIFWIVLVGFVLRVGSMSVNYHEMRPQNDGRMTAIAARLLEGKGMTLVDGVGPTAYRPPVYVLWLTMAYAMFGTFSLLGPSFLQVLVSTGNIFLLFLLAKQVWKREDAAIAAALLLAVHPYTIKHDPALYHTFLSTAFLLGGFILLFKGMEARKKALLFWSGTLFGLCILTISTILPFVGILLACGLILWNIPWRSRVVLVSMFCAGLLLPWGPWAVRNAFAFHEFVPLTTESGLTLWISNNPNAKELFKTRDHEQSTPVPEGTKFNIPSYYPGCMPENRCQGGVSEAEESRELTALSVGWIKSHPRDFAELTAWRYASIWSPFLTPEKDLFSSSVLNGLVKYGYAAWNVLLAVLFAIGARMAWREHKRRELLLLAALALSATGAYAVFLFYTKYRIPFEALLLPIAGAGGVVVFGRFIPGVTSLLKRLKHMNVPAALWWIGIPILTGVFSWAPYAGWNLLTGFGDWWRISLLPPGIFDTYVYLHWMNAAISQLPSGHPLPWISHLLRAMWLVANGALTIPEFWLFTSWIAVTGSVWVAAWVIRKWSSLPRWFSRLHALSFWCFFLIVHRFRPGIYSWLLPFALLGTGSAFLAVNALSQKKIRNGIAWSVLAVVASSAYPWFLMFVVIWLGSAWGAFVIRRKPRIFPWLVALAAGALALLLPTLTTWLLQPSQQVILQMYERNGVGFSHFPQLANTPVAMVFWILLIGILLKRQKGHDPDGPLVLTAWAWIALLLTWCHSLLTGLYTANDHLIAVTAVLSLVSLPLVLSEIRAAQASRTEMPASRGLALLTCGITVFSTLYFLYTLSLGLTRLNKLDSYLIHLVHWFALLTAAWIVVWHQGRPDKAVKTRLVAGVTLAVSIAIGGLALAVVFIREIPRLATIAPERATIRDLDAIIPPHDALCTEPGIADFYAAHLTRTVYPAEATVSYRVTNATVQDRLVTYLGAFDASSTGNVNLFTFYATLYRTSACDFGRGQFGRYTNILRLMGMNDAQAYKILGCPVDEMKKIEQEITRASDASSLNEQSFKALCPWVLVHDASADAWHLPSSYATFTRMRDATLWRAE